MKRVRDILDAKGREVWSIGPDDSVFDAVRRLSDKQVGALLVMDGEKLLGVVSERDYARKIILQGRASRKTPVRDVMSGRVLYVTPSDTVDGCLALMTDKRLRHLPVMENQKVVGVVSIGDLVKAIIDDQKVVIDQLQRYISG